MQNKDDDNQDINVTKLEIITKEIDKRGSQKPQIKPASFINISDSEDWDEIHTVQLPSKKRDRKRLKKSSEFDEDYLIDYLPSKKDETYISLSSEDTSPAKSECILAADSSNPKARALDMLLQQSLDSN